MDDGGINLSKFNQSLTLQFFFINLDPDPH